MDECETQEIMETLPQGYEVVVVGHSLGGGTSCLIGLVLKRRFPYLYETKRLRCLLIAPYALAVGTKLAVESREFQVAVVNETDIVPRVHSHSIGSFRALIFTMLEKSKFSKSELLSVWSEEPLEYELTKAEVELLALEKHLSELWEAKHTMSSQNIARQGCDESTRLFNR